MSRCLNHYKTVVIQPITTHRYVYGSSNLKKRLNEQKKNSIAKIFNASKLGARESSLSMHAAALLSKRSRFKFSIWSDELSPEFANLGCIMRKSGHECILFHTNFKRSLTRKTFSNALQLRSIYHTYLNVEFENITNLPLQIS